MRKRIVTTSAVVAGLLLIGGGTALAVTNGDIAPISEKTDKVTSVPAVDHAVNEAKSSSATPETSVGTSTTDAASGTTTGSTTGGAVSTSAKTAKGGSTSSAPVLVDGIPDETNPLRGTADYGTPNPNPPAPGAAVMPSYDPAQSPTTTGTTSRDPNAIGETTTNPSQITVTYPGQ